MNAALVPLGAGLLDFVAERPARRDEVTRGERLALGRDLRVVGELVQDRHDPGAEFLDLRKGVHLAAAIEREERLADSRLNVVARCESPCAYLTPGGELSDEAAERESTRSRAAPLAE